MRSPLCILIRKKETGMSGEPGALIRSRVPLHSRPLFLFEYVKSLFRFRRFRRDEHPGLHRIMGLMSPLHRLLTEIVLGDE